MRKKIFTLIVAMLSTGCLTPVGIANGISLTTLNNCVPRGEVEHVQSKKVMQVPYAQTAQGNYAAGWGNDYLTFIFRGYSQNGDLLGTVTRRFTWRNEQDVYAVWTIGQGEGDGYHDILRDAQGHNICKPLPRR